jgi:hypothetical protein
VRNPRFASTSANDSLPDPAPGQAMSFADTPRGVDGTDQFLNGRGLY